MKSYLMLMKLAAVNLWASMRSGVTSKKTGKVSVLYIVLSVIGCIGLAALAGVLIFGEHLLFQLLADLGQPMLLPAAVLLICMAFTLLMGLFHALSRLYFSKDSAWMASLPVTSRTVMLARLTEVYLGELVLNVVLLLPVLIMLGVHQQGGVDYYIRAVATVLLSAALPVAVITLLASLLTRITGLVRHREAVLMAGSLLLLAIVLVLEFSILPTIPDDADAMFFVRLILSSSGLVDLLTSALPPIRWAMHGLSGDWAAFGLYALASVGSMAAVVWLMGGRYLDVCIRQFEQAAQRTVRKAVSRDWRGRSQLKALYLREWAEVLRTPAYALNSLESIILMPLMAVFMGAGMASTVPLEEVLPQLRGFIGMIPGAELMLLSAGIMAIGCFINPAISTAISREGRHHDLYRMMPVEPTTQLRAKLLMGMTINQLAALTTGVLLAVLLGEHALWLIPAFLLTVLVNYATCCVSLTIDAAHPRYDWQNETQAIKQSMNVMWGMLTSTILIALPVGVWLLSMFVLEAGMTVRVAGVLATVAVEAVLSFVLMRRVAVKQYAASEG